jgi:hypothetical protein
MLPIEQPTLHVRVDLAAAQRYGLKPGDIRRQAATLVSGTEVGSLFDAQKVFEVIVWGTPDVRGSLESVRNLLLDTPTGSQVRLADVAEVRIVPDPAVIRHDAARTYMDVRAEVVGRPLDAVAGEIEQRVHGLTFPLEYHAEVLGTFAQRQAAQAQLLALGAAAVLGIYLLLQAALGSWRLAALALAALVSALSGGVLVALAGGAGLSLGGVMALLVVFGLAARAVLVQLKHYQHMERLASEPIRPEVVRLGAHNQLAPLLATTLAVALACVALAVPGDLPGLEILRAMAPVTLGGLLTATLVCLFVVPCLYLRFGTSPEPAAASLVPVRVMVAASLLLVACGQRPAAAPSSPKPATVEKVQGSNLARVILTEEGARRIDLRTEPVRLQDGSPGMPYAAIVYDKTGATWVYAAAAEPLTFVRQSISIDAIRGDLVVLKDGPPPGTQVVTVGAAQLYGVEFGVGK